ncbi:MAG: AraC family transcriptional regulator [Candidatus Izemoplasmatales bacterium]
MKLEKISYSIYCMTDISFSFYENNSKVYETNRFLLPEILIEKINANKQTIIENHKDNKVLRIQDKYGLTFLCIYINQRNIIAGPFLVNDDYERYIDEIIINYRLISEEAMMIENFYNNMKVLTEMQQDLFVQVIKNIDNLDLDEIRIQNIQIKNIDTASTVSSPTNDNGLKNIITNKEIEDKLLMIVRNGDVELAQSFDFQKIANQLLIYQNNAFTNMKTNLMVFNALCNREAIKAGVDILLAHKISNNVKFYINKVSLSSEIRNVAQKIILAYAKAVRDYTLLNHSSNIKKIILYIRKNLTHKISLDAIAKELFITKEHLSRLFKKEMKITISEYITETKIQEAKNLLRETDYNILDIAVLLNFANSSHFSNSFKRVTGVSPSDYRKNPTD